MHYLYRNLRLSKHKANQNICTYGEKGDLYFIILEGQVLVKTPSEHRLQGESFSALCFLVFLIEYCNDILWIQLNNGN